MKIEPKTNQKFNDRGYACEIRREEIGYLCGYVTLMEGHPLNDEDSYGYMRNDFSELDCHGGITYCRRDEKTQLITIGFDCGHAGDYIPSIARPNAGRSGGEVFFKDEDYVKENLKSLVDQLITYHTQETKKYSMIKKYKGLNYEFIEDNGLDPERHLRCGHSVMDIDEETIDDHDSGCPDDWTATCGKCGAELTGALEWYDDIEEVESSSDEK